MNTNDYINEIKNRVLNDELYQRVYELHQKEMAREKPIMTEQEYAEAHMALQKNLNASRYNDLLQAEKLYEQSAKWLSQFAFIRGIFAGFQDFFVRSDPAGSFWSLVFEQVMQMPEMERYPDYYEKRSRALALFEQTAQALADKIADHIYNIEAMWQERFFGIVRHSFYLGYRSALRVTDDVSLYRSDERMIDKLLLIEHALGLTDTLAGRERMDKTSLGEEIPVSQRK